MTPNSVGNQFIDDMEWSEPRATGMKHQSDEEDDVSSPIVGAQRRCVDCGQAIPDGAKFCPSCGREQ
jgi:membrane protease subunit (stomatin/prohibitin family)